MGERQRKKERAAVQGRRLPMAILMDWIKRWLVWEMTHKSFGKKNRKFDDSEQS